MKMKWIATLLCLCMISLCACAPTGGESTTPETQPENTLETPTEGELQQTEAAPGDDDGTAPQPEWYEVEIKGQTFLTNGYIVQEPECGVDIYTSTISDFGDFFQESFPVTIETYRLMEETDYEMEVYHIHSDNPGPVVYIVAGVHGDERAGWFTGVLMRQATISSGDLYVLAPANAKGSRELRRTVDDEDMNRNFPGDPEGTPAQQVAYAIYTDIEEKQPEFLFDLHEAIVYTEGRDFLGSTLIFTDLEKMNDMFFDLLFATQMGEICSDSFGYNGPGPAGSINATITRNLGIPTITVETFRGFEIHQRVSDQLDIVQYVLTYKGMR